MIRIALVSYFNTRPFIDGLQRNFAEGDLELKEVPPSACAQLLHEGACDLALVPVGALVDLLGLSIMRDHCLGADGKVDSVFLFSHVPIEQASAIVLDPHSRSSNGLAAVLLREYWNRNLPAIPAQGERFSQIQGSVCGVAIGDKAFALKDQFPYVYDLAEIWKRYSGLPFVFAVWAYRPGRLSQEQLEAVRHALEDGRQGRRDSAKRWAADYGYSDQDALYYLEHSISYEFDSAKHEAMKKYFSLLQQVVTQQT